jgi:MFS family permease
VDQSRLSQSESPPASSEVGGAYAWYTLLVLALVYAVSQADRLILSILAEDVKGDLGATDGQIGFLFGTAFGVFYATFGVSLGRLADFLNRRLLLAVGMVLWSATTILSGMAMNLAELSVARAAIGVGEAIVGPVSYSILSDRFPRSQRATVLAICISGLFVGNGLSKMVGGWVLQAWRGAYPVNPPLGLHAWQVAFFVVGAPGLLAALWVLSLREPVRGASEGMVTPREPKPWSRTWVELSSAVPPLTLFNAARFGRGPLMVNLAAAAVAIAAAVGFTLVFKDPEQWIALSAGIYGAFSWAQSLRHRDRPTFTLILGNSTYVSCMVAFGLLSFISWSVGFWAPPYAMRVLHGSPAEVGSAMGAVSAACGFFGGMFGGRVADMLRKRNPAGRVIVGIAAAIALPVFITAMMHTRSLPLYFAFFGAYSWFGNMWVGAAAALTQDLVLPHMRGAAAACNALAFTLIGLCVGPYAVGKVSAALHDLGLAMELTLVVIPLALALLVYGYRKLPAAEANRVARAERAGLSA